MVRRIQNWFVVAIAVAALAFGLSGPADAKSLYVIASHDGTYSAYNINPDGTITWQANYPSGAWGPAGIALHDDSATLFVTYEFSGYVYIVDATTMTGLGSILAPGASDLAGIDVDDINNIVYTMDRFTQNLYAYDWDASTSTLTLKAGYPRVLGTCEGALGIALDEIAGVLYVACSYYSGGGTVRGFDTSSWTEVMSYVPIVPPVGIAVDRRRGLIYTTAPAGYCAYAPNSYTKLSMYDIATATESYVDMGHGGMGLAVDEVTGYVYVTGGCDGDDVAGWDTSTSPWTMFQSTGYIGSPAGLTLGNASYNPLHLENEYQVTNEEECAVPGWRVTYEICFDNEANPFDVTNVMITDDLPNELAFDSCDGGGYYDSGTHTVTWSIGDVAAGAGQQCYELVGILDITAVPESVFVNRATIESTETPPTTVEEETDVCPIIPVAADIHPTSCRNPINVDRKGVLPVAILGTPDFDVSWIDPATMQVLGASPLRWAWEDVATPFVPFLGKEDAFDCTEDGADGFLDMTLKFEAQEVVGALGDVTDGDVLILTVTGNLLPEFGGMQILGEDVIVIIEK